MNISIKNKLSKSLKVKIISTSSRGNFIYERDENKILELVHPKWFSKKAITKYDNTNIKIEPKNYWGQTYHILKEGIVIVLTPLSNWKKWTNVLAIESPSKCADQKYFDELVIYCGFVVRLMQQYAALGAI